MACGSTTAPRIGQASGTAVDEDVRGHDADPIDTIHQWFSCCADTVEPEIAIADPAGAVPAVGVALQTVAATAQR